LLITKDNGDLQSNPSGSLLNQLAGSIRAHSTVLGLSASQRGVASNIQKTRNSAEQKARKIIEVVSAEGDLLA
jgi:hypothetical protein